VRFPWRWEPSPTAGQPRLSLWVHGGVAEHELILGHRHLLLQPEHEHGGGEHREAEELLGQVWA
jgi:hypothetical protein